MDTCYNCHYYGTFCDESVCRFCLDANPHLRKLRGLGLNNAIELLTDKSSLLYLFLEDSQPPQRKIYIVAKNLEDAHEKLKKSYGRRQWGHQQNRLIDEDPHSISYEILYPFADQTEFNLTTGS